MLPVPFTHIDFPMFTVCQQNSDGYLIKLLSLGDFTVVFVVHTHKCTHIKRSLSATTAQMVRCLELPLKEKELYCEIKSSEV